MNLEKKCQSCGGNAFVEAMDYINLRPVGKKMAMGTEKVYTICLNCGEVDSIKVENPEKLKSIT